MLSPRLGSCPHEPFAPINPHQILYTGYLKTQIHQYQIRKVLQTNNDKKYLRMVRGDSRIGKGISAQAFHRTVLALLNAHGSCRSVYEDSQTWLGYTLSSHFVMVVLVSTIELPKPFALFCFHRTSSLLRFSPQLFTPRLSGRYLESRLCSGGTNGTS